jgi:hypothetical protein
MGNVETEDSTAQRFGALPRWKRWLATIYVLDRRELLMSRAERLRLKNERLDRLAAQPSWKKGLATIGLATAALLPVPRLYFKGEVTIGWRDLGITKTILLSEEPALFFVTLALLEGVLLLLLSVLTWCYFIRRPASGLNRSP